MKINDGKYPLLSTIDSPDDLRRLEISQLPQVCQEIRDFLIDELSVHPGHFASSMGAVEITVALHYVFNTPYDRIVWDVGHQSYGHKLLTGRRDSFSTNRTLGGLSGFPNPDESNYDTFTAGHASNSISAALGMSVASQLRQEDPRRNVVAVIGDASISGGLAFEGLNNAANTPNNLLIILNDNDMSIDNNVGSLSRYLTQITTSKGYNRLRWNAYRLFRKLHLVSEKGKGKILRFNNSLKSLMGNSHNIFEGLNIRYFGPYDGHDIIRLIRILNDIKDMTGPRLLHLRTIKGKGFEAAEKNPAAWHAPGKFDPDTGERLADNAAPSPNPKYQQVFGETLTELATADDRVVAITAAMASGTSISLMQDKMPERVFDVGISEGHAVTFAGGLAKDGMRPVIGIYSSFLQRAYDNLIHDVAIQRLPVLFCIDRAGLVGEDGVTHHGNFDLSYLRTVPNFTICAPADGKSLRRLMYTALSHPDPGPFAIRYPRGSAPDPDWRCQLESLPVGKGREMRQGSDVAVLTIGTVASDAAKAIDMAQADGISAAHYDMIFLKPLDTEILDKVAASGMPVITVEDGTVCGGLGSAVLEYFSQRGYSNPVHVMGVHDAFVSQGTIPQLKEICGIDKLSIHAAIRRAAEKIPAKP